MAIIVGRAGSSDELGVTRSAATLRGTGNVRTTVAGVCGCTTR